MTKGTTASIVLLLGLGVCLIGNGCREGSRRDGPLTRASTSAPSGGGSSAPSAGSNVDGLADAASLSDALSDGVASSDAAVSETAAVDAALPQGTLAYGPATLTGKLAEETFYGAPGYGSDPGHDKKELALVLQLTQSIDVVQPPQGGSEFDVDRSAVAKVSLTDPKDAGLDLHKFIGQRITVKGILFGAHTAHHHTDVLMSGVEVMPE